MKENNFDWLLGAGILTGGNVILFILFGIINFDINKIFSFQQSTDLLNILPIVLTCIAILMIALMIVLFVFFKRRVEQEQTKTMAGIFIILSGILGIFFFKDLIFSYIIYAAWSVAFIWLAISPKMKVAGYDGKKDVLKDAIKKISITLTIGLIIAGLASGMMNTDQHKTELQQSVVAVSGQAFSMETLMTELSIENIIPPELYESYAKDFISQDIFEVTVENNFKETQLYNILNEFQRQEILEEAFGRVETIKTVSGVEGYESLRTSFEQQKLELMQSLDKAIQTASSKIFEMFPILDNPLVFAVIIAISLVATFNLVNGVLIRTLCVHGLFWMVQRDETIIKPKAPKEIQYSERRPGSVA